jgi:hypothetical protein
MKFLFLHICTFIVEIVIYMYCADSVLCKRLLPCCEIRSDDILDCTQLKQDFKQNHIEITYLVTRAGQWLRELYIQCWSLKFPLVDIQTVGFITALLVNR